MDDVSWFEIVVFFKVIFLGSANYFGLKSKQKVKKSKFGEPRKTRYGTQLEEVNLSLTYDKQELLLL